MLFFVSFSENVYYMAGMPLSEYIRKKKKCHWPPSTYKVANEKVIDIAGKYGYNSPTAFNRAFQSIHGISPSAVKSGNVYVKSFPPLSFKLVVKRSRRIVLSHRNKKKRSVLLEYLRP